MAIVKEVFGTAFVKQADGKIIPLTKGMVLNKGDIVLAPEGNVVIEQDGKEVTIDKDAQGVSIQPELFGEVDAIAAAIQSESSDTIIQALERGTDLNETLDATAAGLTGGGGGGSSFVQLSRLLETVTGNNYGYGFSPLGTPGITEGIGEGEVQETETAADTQSTGVDSGVIPETSETPSQVSDEEVPSSPEVPEEEDPDTETPEDDEDDSGEGSDDEDSEAEDPVGDDESDKPNNGGGNGVDDAPGNSGNTPGDEADGSNTPGTGDSGGSDVPVDNGSDDTDGDSPSDSGVKEHQDNGKGNGIDDAPGGSGNTKGDDADGSNTEGTLDSRDLLDDGDDLIFPQEKQNNGFGNGDQAAPGKSGPNNNAENDLSIDLNGPNINELLKNTGNPHFD